MEYSRFKLLPLAATLVFALNACNSGGNDNGGNPPPPPASLGGNAVKGIIKNGNVVAEELDTSGGVIAEVGSATTASDGSYSLTLDSAYKGGPVQITITADATTEMKCDVPAGCGTRSDGITDTSNPTVIDFGEWYKPGSLTMTALVAQADSGATLSVNVTPFTDLATRRAKEIGNLSASVVYEANSEVSNLLGGIDVLNTRPLDITNPASVSDGSATEKAYAALAAAIASLADSASGNPDINGVLDTLASSFTGGTIMADDGGTDASVISLQEIIDAAQSALTQAGTIDTSGAITTNMQSEVDSATGGEVDPVPSDTAGSATLDKVKAFVTDVRTWGTVIDSEIQAKADAFGNEADMASTAAQSSGEFVMSPAFNGAIDAIGGYADGTYTSSDLGSAEYSGMGFTGGTIAVSGDTYTITNGVINGVTVNMTAQIPSDGMTGTSFTLGITSASFQSVATDAYINSGTFTLTTKTDYTINWADINAGTAVEPDIKSGSLVLDLSLTQKQDQLGNPLPASVTFSGNLTITLTNPIKDASGNYVWITPKTLALGGGVMDSSGNGLDFSLSADVANADTFVPVGSLPVGHVHSDLISWAYTDSNSDTVNDTFTLTGPIESATVAWDSVSGNANITQSYSDGYSYSVTSGPYASLVDALNGSGALADVYNNYISGYVWIDGEGGYTFDITTANIAVDGGIDGILQDPDFVVEDPTHWLDANVGLSFNLQLSGLPKASINISADRTDYQSGNATITLAYGTRKIAINGNFTDTTSTGSIDITNQDGVTMTINGANLDAGTGDLTYEGTTYATISSMSGGLTKISYIDGTFETF